MSEWHFTHEWWREDFHAARGYPFYWFDLREPAQIEPALATIRHELRLDPRASLDDIHAAAWDRGRWEHADADAAIGVAGALDDELLLLHRWSDAAIPRLRARDLRAGAEAIMIGGDPGDLVFPEDGRFLICVDTHDDFARGASLLYLRAAGYTR